MSHLIHPISIYVARVACAVDMQWMSREGWRTMTWDLVPSLFLVSISNLDLETHFIIGLTLQI